MYPNEGGEKGGGVGYETTRQPERERERDRDRETETDRQTETDRKKQTVSHIKRDTEWHDRK